MARRRKGLRAQARDWNFVTAEMRRAAAAKVVRCGCPVNAPEADPDEHPCPCGSHCKECGRPGEGKKP